jgi:3-oxochol-4-en-24-oyl-CoA dehydrogenase
MIAWADLDDDVFRLALREWLAANYPPEWRKDSLRPFRRLRAGDLVTWIRRLNAAGLRGSAWHAEYGGMGISFRRQRIYHDEMDRARVARVVEFGEQLLGPVLMAYGTPAQKATLLPRILNGDDIWCQGYSEPNAGSDLASLTTRAVLEGDRFVVSGQKTWTTHAQDATHMFALVRTDTTARKQEGISFLLLDMRAPGVEVRPILNTAGEEEYCEVFLDGVETARGNLVGEINQGWTVAKALLGHERVHVGSPGLCRNALDLARAVVDAMGLGDDQAVADGLAGLAADLHDYEAFYEETCEAIEATDGIPRDVSLLKIYATELQQRICEFMAEVAGEYAGFSDEGLIGDLRADIHWQLMMSRPITIFGGANAVQRDIVATSILGLPRAGA